GLCQKLVLVRSLLQSAPRKAIHAASRAPLIIPCRSRGAPMLARSIPYADRHFGRDKVYLGLTAARNATSRQILHLSGTPPVSIEGQRTHGQQQHLYGNRRNLPAGSSRVRDACSDRFLGGVVRALPDDRAP